MGFKNGCFCTLWNDRNSKTPVVMSSKYADVNLSISKKNQEGNYETDFTSKVRFIGKAFNKIKDLNLQEKDKLKLLEVESFFKYDKDKKQAFANFICWDFETTESVKKEMPKVEVVDLPPLDPEDGLPF